MFKEEEFPMTVTWRDVYHVPFESFPMICGGAKLTSRIQEVQIAGRESLDSRGTGWDQRSKLLDKWRRRKASGRPMPVTDEQIAYLRSLDFGSRFTVEKHEYPILPPYVVVDNRRSKSSSFYRHYEGPCFPYRSNVGVDIVPPWPEIPPTDEWLLVTMGTKAIAATIPTNPVSNLVVGLAEAYSDFPKLIGHSLVKSGFRDPRALGDEFLNYQFGIVPTISDVRKAARAASRGSKLLAQYKRDSGRPMRRRFMFPEVETTTTTEMGDHYVVQPALDSYAWYQPYGKLVKVREERIKTWFSGCYVYHLFGDDTVIERLIQHEQLSNKIAGTRFDLNTAWKLTPYSWLADWVVNAGDVIHNLSAFLEDGLVLRWGYLMQTHEISDTYTLSGFTPNQGDPPMTVAQTFTTVRKSRRRAVPFGFGLTEADFSPRQWAILAAIGISRNRQPARM